MTLGTTRTALAVAVALPLSGALLAVASPAGAAVQQPGDGTVVTTERTIEIRADYPRGASALSVTAPGGEPVTVARGDSPLAGGTLAYDLVASCWRGGEECTGRVPAPNGTWTVAQSGSVEDRTTFVLRIAPQAPDGLTATVGDGRQVRLAWKRGVEPDLRGYALLEKGREQPTPLPLSVCEADACSTTLSYADAPGGERSYALTAVRADGGSGSLESAPAQASATVPADPAAAGDGAAPGASPASSGGPAASGSPSPGSSPGPSPGATGVPSASAAASQAARDGLSSRALGPTLGLPGLPTVPGEESPRVAPLPDGTFAPTLGFDEREQVLRERFDTQLPAERVTAAVRAAVDSERLATSTAAALVLLLCGAHLQRWLRASSAEQLDRPS